jgi:hypothetical protein
MPIVRAWFSPRGEIASCQASAFLADLERQPIGRLRLGTVGIGSERQGVRRSEVVHLGLLVTGYGIGISEACFVCVMCA